MRGLVPSFHELLDDLKDKADFLFVYIKEAHAVDEWPISSSRFNDDEVVCVKQPTTMKERIDVAKYFVEKFKLKLTSVCDTMENDFEKNFAPWPLRFYIIENGKLIFKAQPNNASYDVSTIRTFLDNKV